ncbi:hypothetical protein [Dyadobacter chenhuakuii]|uniref:Uncharacterized protein n=1 Tax=Dyadobacter chenhuakuii TaxID=2909339 RepID=A0A9X1QC78_9BACT|nr:hypothetical protein [Dyadobacter chenhuakuii]MCF2498406.1 hypothetical protein [Dyadobacter chenhuakuii]
MSDIINLIKTHIEKLTGITVTYQYSELHEMHLLEVLPYEKLEDDTVFNAVQDIIDAYIDQNPAESWYIVSPNSRIKIVGTPTFAVERQEGHTDSAATNDLYGSDDFKKYIRTILMSKTIKVDSKVHAKIANKPSKGVFENTDEYYAQAA